MKPILPILLFAGIAATPNVVAQAQDVKVAEASAEIGDVGFDKLASEFDQARRNWKEALSAAEGAEKRALRKARPEIAFYSRFKEAGLAGSGQSLLWLLSNGTKAGIKKDQRRADATLVAERLMTKHADEAWMLEQGVFKKLVRLERTIGADKVEALFLAAGEKAKKVETRAMALMALAERQERSKDEAIRARGAAIRERVEKTFPLEALQAAFSGENFKSMFLGTGMIAPDFTAKTVDGESFKLSDYRGKVTLIDFWGFW